MRHFVSRMMILGHLKMNNNGSKETYLLFVTRQSQLIPVCPHRCCCNPWSPLSSLWRTKIKLWREKTGQSLVMTGGLLSEPFASVSADIVCLCEQNVMIQIAPLGLHKTSWAHVRAVSGQAWITKGISSCSSLTLSLPLLRQLGFITHDGDSWVLTQTSHNRAVCHLIRGVTFLADFTDDECPCNVPCAVSRDTRYASHSRSHKGCEQKLSSYLDHKVQSSHIFSLLSTFITLYVMFWSWDSFLEPVKMY